MLKELELVESNMIQTIFEYNKQSRVELQKTMKSVATEHKSGWMDPASYASKMKKNRNRKRKKINVNIDIK